MAQPAAVASSSHKHHSLGFNLAAIALGIALAGLAAAYAIDNLVRTQRGTAQAESATVVRNVAARELTIPRTLLRYDEPETAGFSNEVDLRLTLPLGLDGAMRTVDVTLMPRSKARPSSALLDGVYLHQFTLEEVPGGPPGLVGKPLKGTDGYKGETVWYDPLSPDPFVAKCEAPLAAGQPGRCLRTVFFDKVAGIYAFDADLLANWRDFDHEAEAILFGLGVHKTR